MCLRFTNFQIQLGVQMFAWAEQIRNHSVGAYPQFATVRCHKENRAWHQVNAICRFEALNTVPLEASSVQCAKPMSCLIVFLMNWQKEGSVGLTWDSSVSLSV
jgi:hypothetical protein